MLFIIMLVSSTLVGVYFGCFGTKQSTKNEYLMGDKKMKPLPVAILLVASNTYTVFLLSLPADVYQFGAVTDIDARLITPIVCTVCIFYTAIGGLKAVIWTDTLQFTITTITFVTILILGMQSAGGLSTVWNKAIKEERLHIFNFDPDPTKRDSFWIILIGGVTLNMMSYTTVDQSFLVPYYVMDVVKNIPGLAGLFTSGLFGAALSALSAILNCTTGALYEDFLSKCLKKNLSQKSVSRVLKAITLVSGLVIICMVFAVEHLGNIFPLLVDWTGLTGGSILGMFTIGVLSSRANAKDAFYEAIGSLIVTSSIGIPAKYYEIQGILTLRNQSLQVVVF
ncbi:SSF domain containing protein, partial [Asbolus verrucosus]